MTPATATDGVYAALLEMAAAAPIIERPAPPESAPPPAAGSNGQPAPAQPAAGAGDPFGPDCSICESIGLDVLGETIDRQVVVFAQGKTGRVPKIAQFKYPDLLQICGPGIRERVHLSQDGPPGSHHFERVKEAIAVVAGRQRLYDATIRGAGVWPGEGGRLVLVGRGEAAVWAPATKNLERVTRPKAAGLLLDLDSSPRWYDHAELVEHLTAAEDPTWRQAALDELHGVLALWRWKTPAAATLLSGMVLATWIQTAWRWRPHVALTGESTAGKSSFLGALAGLFGPLAHLVNKPSEAALRQSLHGRACAILIDEFETDQHRRRVLELLRTSGTGSKIIRGTTHQAAIEFGLCHICWVSAIEVGTDRQPDANRYLTVEMLKPTRQHRADYRRLPGQDALAVLGRRLLAVAVWAAREALTLTDSLKTREVAGLDPRTVESLAVPAATLAVTMGLSESAAGEMLEFLAAQTEREEGREPDHVQLVHSILASTVTLDRGVMTTVGELLGRTTGGFSETHEPLERVGVAIVAEQRGPREFASERSAVFFDCKTIRRYLLKDTEWTSQQIDTHLLRLETATRSRRRIGGRLVWGVEFEWTWFAEHFLDKGDGENAQTTTAEY